MKYITEHSSSWQSRRSECLLALCGLWMKILFRFDLHLGFVKLSLRFDYCNDFCRSSVWISCRGLFIWDFITRRAFLSQRASERTLLIGRKVKVGASFRRRVVKIEGCATFKHWLVIAWQCSLTRFHGTYHDCICYIWYHSTVSDTENNASQIMKS